MNRSEYIRRLDEALNGIGLTERKEIIDEFERHFEEGVMSGRSEEEIAEQLGSPEQAADDLRILTRKEDDVRTLAEAASTVAEVIRKTLSRGFGVPHSRQAERKTYEGSCEAPVREVRISGKLSSVDIDIRTGGRLEYTFTEGMNLFMANDVQFETEETEDAFLISVSGGHGDLSLTIPPAADLLDIRIADGDITLHDLNLQSAVMEVRSGDIEIFDTDAETLSVHSVSGDVTLTRVNTARTECGLHAGDIEMTGCTGRVTAKTLSGDIDITDHDGEEADLSCRSGDIDLVTAARLIRAESASGDIEIRTTGSTDDVSVMSGSGDIDLDLAGSDWQAVLQTAGGDIKNKTRLPAYREGARLYVGDGRGRITVRTRSGDIRIR